MKNRKALSLCFAFAFPAASGFRLTPRGTSFDWTRINSTKALVWTQCYDTFECARLTVPLQYSNPGTGEAQIALVMSPSKFSSEDPNYLGSILFNPGGPGESGVEYVLQYETYFRNIIGPQYDLVGFDPRGAGDTTPFLSVFKTPQEALEIYSTFPLDAEGSVSSLGRAYTQSQIVADLAVDRAKLVAESVGTPAVATDMLQIARALGQEKVNYWGISYGSVIGATFAAMFPDHVGHFVIDGVTDSHQYYYGPGTQDMVSLLDTDAALTSVYDACVTAGPSLCAIWENNTDLVRARVERALDVMRVTPLPIYNHTDPSTITFGVLDYATVYQALFHTVYFPYSQGASAVEAFVALEHGDGAALYAGSFASSLRITDDSCATSSQPFVAGFIDVTSPIVCGDSVVGRRSSFAQYQKDYKATQALSPFAAAWHTDFFGPCATWPLQGKDHLNGSFETSTSTPILFISNTLDPITPIQGGRSMSTGFRNSVLLEQNSTGHTSLSGFSTCTARAIRAYFRHGILPASGTVCQPDTQIFDAPNNSSGFGGVTISFSESDEADSRVVNKSVPEHIARE